MKGEIRVRRASAGFTGVRIDPVCDLAPCPRPFAVTIAGVRICQHHADIVAKIERDAIARRRRIRRKYLTRLSA